MASNVLYGQDVFRPYFSMKKFENTIYNRYAERDRRIKYRRRLRVIDRFIVVAILLLTVTIIAALMIAFVRNIKITQRDREISKLETTLDKAKYNNSGAQRIMKSEIKFDDLKMKAYMELNMITPTEKNIIYFDKSDNGFVRQYENIR